MSRKTLDARPQPIVITLEKDVTLYLQEACPIGPLDGVFMRRVLCCKCFQRVAWTETNNRLVKYVKTYVPCKSCRSTKKEA